MPKPSIQTFAGDYAGMKTHQASGTVDLRFSVPGTGGLLVTIPLHSLVRLQRESQRKDVLAKHQAYRDSKKVQS